MKKKLLRLIALITCIACCLSCLASCKKPNENKGEDGSIDESGDYRPSSDIAQVEIGRAHV